MNAVMDERVAASRFRNNAKCRLTSLLNVAEALFTAGNGSHVDKNELVAFKDTFIHACDRYVDTHAEDELTEEVNEQLSIYVSEQLQFFIRIIRLFNTPNVTKNDVGPGANDNFHRVITLQTACDSTPVQPARVTPSNAETQLVTGNVSPLSASAAARSVQPRTVSAAQCPCACCDNETHTLLKCEQFHVLPVSDRNAKPEINVMYNKQPDNKAMDTMISSGYAEEVPHADPPSDRSWYLPHHHVYSPAKPAKVRVVFDCSVRSLGSSLNDRAYQRSKLTTLLNVVLLICIMYSCVISGDVQSIYNQVKLPVGYVDMMCFLWNGRAYRKTSHLFAESWCATSAVYALHRVMQCDYVHSSDDAIPSIRNALYVDDLLLSYSCPDRALSVWKEVKGSLATRCSNVTNFVTNHLMLLASILAVLLWLSHPVQRYHVCVANRVQCILSEALVRFATQNKFTWHINYPLPRLT